MFESRPEDKEFFDKISHYCDENGYEHVWFCHDVEEVFLGAKVSSNNKVKMAGTFKQKKRISAIDECKLKSKVMKSGCSNVLNVFDKYLQKK